MTILVFLTMVISMWARDKQKKTVKTNPSVDAWLSNLRWSYPSQCLLVLYAILVQNMTELKLD